MRKLVTTSFVVFIALGLAGAAHAQTATPAPAPAPIPDVMPFDIPIGTPITLDHAKQVAAAAVAEAKKRNWKMAITIVEPTGDLVYFEKLDGTQYASGTISQGKARAAATYRRQTKVFQDLVNSGQPYLLSLPGVVASEGGIPLVENGKLIGAIGVSGGTSPQDGVVSKAGADTVK
jgi:glc operon protein GlcG